jgi:hypothetical protein
MGLENGHSQRCKDLQAHDICTYEPPHDIYVDVLIQGYDDEVCMQCTQNCGR